jgi:hypothetical protein
MIPKMIYARFFYRFDQNNTAMKILFILTFLWMLTGSAHAQDTPADTTITRTVDSLDTYGLVPEQPIKVGGLFTGGPGKQREYLEALRDAQGKRISYERKGHCCAYPSRNGFDGQALLDKYEVTYRDGANKKQKTILYISFYDYEEPRAVKGFTLVND